MDNFVFHNPTKIIFGRGTEAKVGVEAAAISKKVLLHYGSGSIKKSGLFDRVMASLKAAGVTVVELGGVAPNPRLSLVREGIKICREQKIASSWPWEAVPRSTPQRASRWARPTRAMSGISTRESPSPRKPCQSRPSSRSRRRAARRATALW